MTKRIYVIPIVCLIFALGIPSAWKAGQGNSPIASDQHTGIDGLARVMNHAFKGQVFYEHWLGWELRYYLSADPQVFVLYFETPDDLADYALQELPGIPVPRYFVAPKIEAPPWIVILERRGIRADVVLDDGHYIIYALTLNIS